MSPGTTDASCQRGGADPGGPHQVRTRPSAACTSWCPGGAHTYARGSDQYPEDLAPVIVRGRGPGSSTSTATSTSSTAWGCGPVTLGHGYRAGRRGGLPCRDRRGQLHPALRCGARGRRTVPRAGADRRHGEVRQERLRRDDGGGAAGPRRDRSRPRGRLRRPALLLDRRLVHRHDADGRRHPAAVCASATVAFRLQRPRRPSRRCSTPTRARSRAVFLEPATGTSRARPRLPRGRARAGRPRRLRPRLRRDDHRHALVRGRRPGGLRRDAGPVHVGQGARQRLRRLGAGRAPGPHGARRAAAPTRRGSSCCRPPTARRPPAWPPSWRSSDAYRERDVVAEMESPGGASLRSGFEALVLGHGLERVVEVIGRPSCLRVRDP